MSMDWNYHCDSSHPDKVIVRDRHTGIAIGAFRKVGDDNEMIATLQALLHIAKLEWELSIRTEKRRNYYLRRKGIKVK